MKNKRTIYFFWALVLVPTLFMAGAALKLLNNEQERINLSAIHTLTQRALSVSETIHLTIETIQDNLEQSLLEIEEQHLKSELVQWEAGNPLVRNFFIFNPETRLEYPVKGLVSTSEERRFMNRYDSLFSGRIKFEAMGGQTQETGQSESLKKDSVPAGVASYSISEKIDSISKKEVQSSRKRLIALSRQAKENKMLAREAKAPEQSAQKYVGKKGWIPWFNENHLFLLGWVQKYDAGSVYGVELELMTLLSRLVVDFPVVSEAGVAMVLMDGNGNAIHQSGRWVDTQKEKSVARVPVSNLLPHWQVAVFVDTKGFGSQKGFLYLSMILLGIFIAAIVSGGILLTRLTLSNIRDAREKTSFVASVSHELKTPLTSIRMYAELLLSGRIKDQDKALSYLGVIVSESQRLTRLINNVLDFGKLEQGKKRYAFRSVDVSEFLSQILDAHRIRIKKQGLEIVTRIHPGNYGVQTDPDALEQVVLNVLDNALKYAGKGKFIKFVLARNHQAVLLKVCDDGPGIPNAQKELIFKKFHRVDDSLTSRQPGSGLGLSIARQIMQDLNGELKYEPMPENGSCFIVQLNDQDIQP